MTPELPENLARYFASQNAHDGVAMVACFASDARVHDEGQDYVGRDAIRRWKEHSVAKYDVRVAPLDLREKEGRTNVTAKVMGNFPGSPVDLTFSFCLNSEGLIHTLEIR